MAKRRKTREQKIAVGAKRQQGQYLYTFTKPLQAVKLSTSVQYSPTQYSYVYIDLKKTLVVCLGFVVFELLLLLILQHHLLSIPGVSY